MGSSLTHFDEGYAKNRVAYREFILLYMQASLREGTLRSLQIHLSSCDVDEGEEQSYDQSLNESILLLLSKVVGFATWSSVPREFFVL